MDMNPRTVPAPGAKVTIAGVQVLNLHALSLALRPPVVTGEDINVQLIKPGREQGQAVGYLDDGTMVVVEQGRSAIGQEVGITVTSVLQTNAGRMIFGRIEGKIPAAGGTTAVPGEKQKAETRS